MGNPTYFLILMMMLVGAVLIHFSQKLVLFKNKKHFWLYFGLVFLVGFIWDYFSVWREIWLFPEGGTLGLRLGILPIEEYLFFMIVPYFGLVVHKFLEKNLL